MLQHTSCKTRKLVEISDRECNPFKFASKGTRNLISCASLVSTNVARKSPELLENPRCKYVIEIVDQDRI